jgi:hypothetical protein
MYIINYHVYNIYIYIYVCVCVRVRAYVPILYAYNFIS